MVQLLIAPYTPLPPHHPFQSLEWMLQMQTAPFETAAVFLEPILGEGGFLSPPPGFMRALRALCDKHGILVIADEVWRRVGMMCTLCDKHNVTGHEWEGVRRSVKDCTRCIPSLLPSPPPSPPPPSSS